MSESESGSGSRSVDPRRVVPAEEFLRKHPQPVILNFKPTGFVRVESPAELRRWEEKVRELVGLPVVVGSDGGSGTAGTISDTICALSEGAIEDDCDYD